MLLTKVHKGFFFNIAKYLFFIFSSLFQHQPVYYPISQRMARTTSIDAAISYSSSTFTDFEVNNFMDIMGEIIPIGPLEWASAINHHKVSFANKNRDMQSLQQKLNSLSRMTLSTSDPNVPQFLQKAKDMQHAIEIKMDSGRVTFQDLGINIADDTGGLDGDGSNLDGKL
jgi:hypothetical protein